MVIRFTDTATPADTITVGMPVCIILYVQRFPAPTIDGLSSSEKITVPGHTPTRPTDCSAECVSKRAIRL